MNRSTLCRVSVAALIITALITSGNAGYIHAKAILAQVLIRHAFESSIGSSAPLKPWQWADTWPVARLTVPRLSEERFVLQGAHGSALAFGPGLMDGTGEGQTMVIAAHRDTHFKFLEYLVPGDAIELQLRSGVTTRYRVAGTKIVDERIDPGIEIVSGAQTLYLVTCYPFDALIAGGPLRYLVKLEVESGGAT